LLCAALLLLGLPPRATAASPALTAQDKELFAALAEAYHLSREKGNTVWSGFDLHERPVVFHDRNRVAFLVNHPAPPKGFTKLSQALPLPLKTPVYVRYGRSPELEAAGSLGIRVNGVPTALLPYPLFFYDGVVTPRDFVPAFFASYIQQNFPQFQDYEKLAQRWANDYPSGDQPNMALADLENKMLAVALKAETLDLARQNVRWFLAVRRDRQSRLAQNHQTYEDQAEAVEGATRFVESMTMAAASSQYRPLQSPFLKGAAYPKTDPARPIVALLHQDIDPNGVRRDRFSLTGAAMAMLLDRFEMVGWRAAMTTGKRSLTTLLARAVDYSEADRDHLLAEAKRVYAYERTLRDLETRLAQTPTTLKAFNALPGTRLTVMLHPVDSLLEPEAEPRRAGKDGLAITSSASPVEIDASTLLAFNLDAFDYQKGPLVLRVKGRPILMRSTDIAWPFQNVSFHANPTKLKLTLDGKATPIQKGSRVFSRSLKLEGDGILLQAGHGTLFVRDGEIQVISR
jgi:hypothetical protein